MAGQSLPQGAWVVIADGEKALILVNEGDAQNINLVLRRKEVQDNPQAQDWATPVCAGTHRLAPDGKGAFRQ
jgi:protein required for attachment to host cells